MIYIKHKISPFIFRRSPGKVHEWNDIASRNIQAGFTIVKKESGQAVAELTAALLALCFTVIGLLFVGGIGISATKTLISARSEAERSASAGAEGNGGSVSDVGGWQYTSVTYRKDRIDGKIDIPFLGRDEPNPVSVKIDSHYLFEDIAPSLSQSNADLDGNGRVREYIFLPRSGLTELITPQNMLSGSSADLANLHFSSGTLPDAEEVYTLRKLENRRDFRERIHRAGWFDLRKITVRDWRSNQVAMPAFGPVTPGTDE